MEVTIEQAIKSLSAYIDNEAYTDKFQNVCKLAIEALEKQIPKKDKFGYCPICKRTVNCACRPSKNKFCRNCGQALDWSDQNDENRSKV